jgi:hypothetical protein
MFAFLRSKIFRILAGALAIALVTGAGVIAWLNPRLTRYVESDEFRAELEEATAKGLHFPSGRYAPIRRTGFFTASSDEFHAERGWKAMTSLDAKGLTAKFNPWGVFLRRWQLDEVQIDSGEVGIQVYEPKPEPSPAKPWFHIFLPDRVYLKRVEADPTDITWRFRNEKGGFFKTHLVITPHGRDFEYRARGGMLKVALIPDLHLHQTHLLITKTRLTLYELNLAPEANGAGFIHAEGTAGTREDKSVDFKVSFGELPISPWLPANWKGHFNGAATGEVHWQGVNPKLESSFGQGRLKVDGAHITGLPSLEKLASITKKRSIEQLNLSEGSFDLEWRYPRTQVKNIAIEDDGKFRIEGAVSINHNSLGGSLELGVAREYLEWLPKAEEIFTREHDGYLWTTVHLSGTVQKPKQDLSPRVLEALKESPGASLRVLFRLFGEWLKDVFGGE